MLPQHYREPKGETSPSIHQQRGRQTLGWDIQPWEAASDRSHHVLATTAQLARLARPVVTVVCHSPQLGRAADDLSSVGVHIEPINTRRKLSRWYWLIPLVLGHSIKFCGQWKAVASICNIWGNRGKPPLTNNLKSSLYLLISFNIASLWGLGEISSS